MKRRRDSASDSETLETPKKIKMSIGTEQNLSSTSHPGAESAMDDDSAPPKQTSRASSQAPPEAATMSKPNKTSASNKKKRPPRNRQPSMLKRSISTPHLPTAGLVEDEPESPGSAEKRRNKLGYHRTSVACGHCRRRKIRCLVDLGDGQGRCTNCIRLKKECNFYPVEQVVTSEKRGKSSKSESASGRVSAKSSSTPPLHSASLTAQSDDYSIYSHIPITSPHEFAIPSNPRSGLGIMALQDEQLGTVYPPGFDTPDSWEPVSYSHQAAMNAPFDEHAEGLSNNYWKLSDQTATGSYTQFEQPTIEFNQAVSNHGAPSYGDQRNIGWLGPAQRSMSLSHIDNVPRNFPARFPRTTQDVPQRPSTLLTYTPSINTSANSSNASLSDVTSLPLSAPIGRQMTPHFAFRQHWSPYNVPQPFTAAENKANDTFGDSAWYQEALPLEQVSEEHEEGGNILESQHGRNLHEQFPGQPYQEFQQHNFTGPYNPG